MGNLDLQIGKVAVPLKFFPDILAKTGLL